MPRYYAPDRRAAGPDRADHRPGGLHRGVRRAPARHHARHRHQRLPFWEGTRLWVIARPLSGFAETFSQYVVEVSPGGGSDRPEPDPGAEGVLFVVEGDADADRSRGEDAPAGARRLRVPAARAALAAAQHRRRGGAVPLDPQGLPAGRRGRGARAVRHQRGRRRGRGDARDRRAWTTQRFVDPLDVRHDMHVNIVNFEPGGVIPFPETHVMEHGLYVLEGKAVYLLNKRLGRGPGGRLHVAARVLPAGLLCRRARPVPLPALQGRQPARRALPAVRLR